jgi:hypothetical protein
LRTLRPPAPPVRQLPRRGRAIRPLLRILRSRDGARGEPSDVVEAVAAGSAGAAGGRPCLRHSPGRITPSQVSLGRTFYLQSHLAIQTLAAFDAEAVTSQVVVSAGRADEPSWRVGLQPALPLASVPDAVLRAEHPPPPLAVEDCQVAHGKPEGARLEVAGAAILDQVAIACLGLGEGIYSHAQSIAREGLSRPGIGAWQV